MFYNPESHVDYQATRCYEGGNYVGEVPDIFWFIFKPLVEAFLHCRPVIAIDATFLNGKYKGKLLVAMVTDADNHVFPVAFAFVDEESKNTWSYFLHLLKKVCHQWPKSCV